MPELKQSTVDAIGSLAKPFESLDEFILRLAEEHRARSNNGNAMPGEVGAHPGGVRSFPPTGLPDVSHTKLVKSAFAGKDYTDVSWNEFVRLCHEVAFAACGKDYDELRSVTTANIVKGQKTDDGYKPIGQSFSLQGVAANDALRIVIALARKLSVPIEVMFDWRAKDGAAYPGETGRIVWKPTIARPTPYWSAREFKQSDLLAWHKVQDEFERHYMRIFAQTWSADRRGDMLLVMTSDNDRGVDTLYMRLPATENPYKGFTPMPNTRLPRDPSLLVGDQIGYDELFKKA